MFDHVSVGVGDVEAAALFYREVLAPLGYGELARMESLVAFGADRIAFVAMRPFDGEAATGGNGVHVAFVAPTRAAVDAFHARALAGGGKCEGAPGPRAYPHREVYAAFVRDPFGNKLEALTDGFAA